MKINKKSKYYNNFNLFFYYKYIKRIDTLI